MKSTFTKLAVLAVLLVTLGAVLHSQGFKNADLFLFGHRGDTSIARLAAGSIAVGNGGDQDYSGTFTSATNVLKSPNGAMITKGQASEVLSAPTSGTTTDSVANLLPANATIIGVTARVTTTISGGTCSSWAIGDATTSGRWIAADSTLTAGETQASTGTGFTTGIASATTGMHQGAAAKVRLTCGTGSATGGAVRVTVFYEQPTPATS